MTGRHLTTTSPSRVSSSRSTPWVDGCWGPMFTVSSSRFSTVVMTLSVSADIPPPGRLRPRPRTAEGLEVGVADMRPESNQSSGRAPSGESGTAVDPPGHREVDGFGAEWLGTAQGVPLPRVGQHDALQVGMTFEANPEQVEELA